MPMSLGFSMIEAQRIYKFQKQIKEFGSHFWFVRLFFVFLQSLSHVERPHKGRSRYRERALHVGKQKADTLLFFCSQ
jgi:hypothetical protein